MTADSVVDSLSRSLNRFYPYSEPTEAGIRACH
jgi:hypothetical protein